MNEQYANRIVVLGLAVVAAIELGAVFVTGRSPAAASADMNAGDTVMIRADTTSENDMAKIFTDDHGHQFACIQSPDDLHLFLCIVTDARQAKLHT